MGILSLLLFLVIALFALRGSFGRKPKLVVGVHLPKSSYFLGEVIGGVVHLEAGEDLDLKGATVQLRCRQASATNPMLASRAMPNLGEPRMKLDPNLIYDEKVDFDVGLRLGSGEKREVLFSIAVPSSGQPTHGDTGDNLSSWSLDVEVRSGGRRAMQGGASVTVEVPRVV